MEIVGIENAAEESSALSFQDKIKIALVVGGAGLVLAGLLFWLSKVEERFPQYEPGQNNPTPISQEATPANIDLEQ